MTWLSNHPATYNMHKTCSHKCVFGVVYNLRLNTDKCVFGVDSRKFLGFMLTQCRIEANLEKCKAIIEMRNLTNVKEV